MRVVTCAYKFNFATNIILPSLGAALITSLTACPVISKAHFASVPLLRHSITTSSTLHRDPRYRPRATSSMPARTRKPRINEKDEGALILSEDDFRRYWVSADGLSLRNAHPKVAFNRENNGFDHPKLTEMLLINTKAIDAPNFADFNPEEETKYLSMVRDKLSLTKDYILKEQELSLDPDRIGMHHTTTPKLLAVPPIVIDIHAQQIVRLLIESEAELRRLNADTPEDKFDAVLDQPMRDYLELWAGLQASLVWQLPGEDAADKMNKADRIMDEVFEKLVEP
ncbi:hypothetical protein IG631_03219 [Alternaria alternata]|nr:hypothetical protein IG631_03219 [Alternaria alternata]